MGKDVISIRVDLRVKEAWDNLSDSDKDRIRGVVEALIMLQYSGFNIELVNRGLDSLRAEICPTLSKIVEYYAKTSCIRNCFDDNVRNYFYTIQYITQRLCSTHPVKREGP